MPFASRSLAVTLWRGRAKNLAADAGGTQTYKLVMLRELMHFNMLLVASITMATMPDYFVYDILFIPFSAIIKIIVVMMLQIR